MNEDNKTKAVTQLRDAIDLDSQLSAPALTVIFHPELERIGDRALLPDLLRGEPIVLSRLEPQFQADDQTNQSLNDLHISRKPISIELLRDSISITRDNEGSELTVNGDLVRSNVSIPKAELAQGIVLKLASRVVLLLHEARLQSVDMPERYGLIGNSDNINQVRQTIAKVQDLDVSVLIRGESGTGKELIAQAIHRHSPRANGPIISINMAAIPNTLAVAELFGAKKGAYTGANKDKIGHFQQAHGGSLFMDEIGDASEEVQAILLRALETREILPVGASDALPVDIRLIAATDADLDKMIEQDEFRTPLLQRLAGFEIRIAALRDRKEDIGILFASFIQRELDTMGETIAINQDKPRVYFWASVFEKACLFDWPGNIRQLHNIAQQIVIQNRGMDTPELPDNVKELFLSHYRAGGGSNKVITQTSLNEQLSRIAERADTPTNSESAGTSGSKNKTPVKLTDDEFAEAMASVRWDVSKAADKLQLSRAALYKRIDKHPSLRKAGDIDVAELQSSFQAANGELSVLVDELQVSESALKRRLKELNLID